MAMANEQIEQEYRLCFTFPGRDADSSFLYAKFTATPQGCRDLVRILRMGSFGSGCQLAMVDASGLPKPIDEDVAPENKVSLKKIRQARTRGHQKRAGG